ncbi:unnamed protein product [Boreogadus saida]
MVENELVERNFGFDSLKWWSLGSEAPAGDDREEDEDFNTDLPSRWQRLGRGRGQTAPFQGHLRALLELGPFSGLLCASCPASLAPGDGHLVCFVCLGTDHAEAAMAAPVSCVACRELPEEGILSRHLFFSPAVDLTTMASSTPTTTPPWTATRRPVFPALGLQPPPSRGDHGEAYGPEEAARWLAVSRFSSAILQLCQPIAVSAGRHMAWATMILRVIWLSHTAVAERERASLVQGPLAPDGLFGPRFSEVLAHQQSVRENRSRCCD